MVLLPTNSLVSKRLRFIAGLSNFWLGASFVVVRASLTRMVKQLWSWLLPVWEFKVYLRCHAQEIEVLDTPLLDERKSSWELALFPSGVKYFRDCETLAPSAATQIWLIHRFQNIWAIRDSSPSSSWNTARVRGTREEAVSTVDWLRTMLVRMNVRVQGLVHAPQVRWRILECQT